MSVKRSLEENQKSVNYFVSPVWESSLSCYSHRRIRAPYPTVTHRRIRAPQGMFPIQVSFCASQGGSFDSYFPPPAPFSSRSLPPPSHECAGTPFFLAKSPTNRQKIFWEATKNSNQKRLLFFTSQRGRIESPLILVAPFPPRSLPLPFS